MTANNSNGGTKNKTSNKQQKQTTNNNIMMIRIFSSKYIVAVLATMAMTSNNSNGGVHAKDLATIGQAYYDAAGNLVDATTNAAGNYVDYVLGKDSNETDIPDDVDVGVPNEEGKTNTGPDDGQAVASQSGQENVAAT